MKRIKKQVRILEYNHNHFDRATPHFLRRHFFSKALLVQLVMDALLDHRCLHRIYFSSMEKSNQPFIFDLVLDDREGVEFLRRKKV